MSALALSSWATLWHQSLSWNEAVTASAAQRSWPNLFSLLGRTDAPLGLYYTSMHVWLDLTRAAGLPADEVVLRLPSVLATTVSALALLRLAREWYGSTVGMIAASLFALHPLVVFYAQDARPYAMVTMVNLLAITCLRRWLAAGTTRLLTLYGGLCIAVVYLHLFAIYAIAAHALLVVGSGRWRRWLTTMAVVAVAAAPLALVARGQASEIGWIPPQTPAGILSVVVRVCGGAAMAAMIIFLGATLARTRRWSLLSRPTVFLLAWAIVPLAMLIAVGFAHPDLVARYALISVPALTLLVALAVSSLVGRTRLIVLSLTIAATVGATAVQLAAPYKYEDYRAATDVVDDQSRTGDAIVFAPASVRLGYDAYHRLDSDNAYPLDVALRTGSDPAHSAQLPGAMRPANEVAMGVAAATRVFLVSDQPSASLAGTDAVVDAALGALAQRRVIQSTRWGQLWVTVYAR